MPTSKSSVRIRKGELLLIIINFNEYIISKNYFSLTRQKVKSNLITEIHEKE